MSGRFVTRSSVPAERALQSWGLTVLAWVIVSVLVVGGVLIAGDVGSGGTGSTEDRRPIGHETLRAVLGAVHVLICLVLAVLVRRHLGAIRSTRGLAAQYRNAALGVAVLSCLCFFFFWYGGLVAAAFLVVVAVGVSRIQVLPGHAMTAEVETGTSPLGATPEPELFARGRWQAEHRWLSVLLIVLVPFVLVAVIIGVGLLLV